MKSEIDGNLASKDICIVAQTTINRDFFGEIVQNVKKNLQKYPSFLIQYVVRRRIGKKRQTNFEKFGHDDCNRGKGKLKYKKAV